MMSDKAERKAITIGDIAKAIEEYAPLPLQEDYDNAGLQTGDPTAEAKSALICLDVTKEIMDEAIALGCDMVISHHPLIFRGLKSVTAGDPTSEIIRKAIKHDIAIYSAHTNMDNTNGGVSYEMAKHIGMTDVEVLAPMNEAKTFGSGLIGNIQPTRLGELLEKMKKEFGTGAIRYCGDKAATVRRVAVCGGSGAFLIPQAIVRGADLYISGDIKYHDFTANKSKINLADIGHYESEQYTKTIFYRIISEKFANFAVYISKTETNPINYL